MLYLKQNYSSLNCFLKMKNPVLISLTMIALFVAANQNMHAQTTSVKDITKQKRHTAVYAELFGTSLLYSLNVEERWQLDTWSQLGVRVGFSYFRDAFLFSDIKRVFVPILLNYSRTMGPSNQHFIEFGAGAQIADLRGYTSSGFFDKGDYYNGTYILPTASLNYRYQGPKGFMVKAGITPSFRYQSGIVGLSLGYSF
jgi:hypothetical protein